MDDLRDVQKQLSERPSAGELDLMLKGVEETFQNHLGENVYGLKGLVQQVYKHIQNKVDRDDIKHLISSKLGQMEREMVQKEEEMLKLASTTRCLSCGQMPRPHSQMKKNSQSHSHSPTPVAAPSMEIGERMMMTDDIDSERTAPQVSSPHASIVFEQPDNARLTNNPYSTSHTEQVYALLTGQVGLKPIQLHHAPVMPKERGTSSQSAVRTEKIPEPLYRKTRMAQQIRDMVKVF
jgi:hypothetical protein